MLMSPSNSKYLPLGDKHETSLKMAIASPDVVMIDAFFNTDSLNASTGSTSPAASFAGMWNRISDNCTTQSSF